jgi:hypothetical protein
MNVWVWGPPMWDTLHACSFLCDAKNISAKPLFESLTQLLPCRYCRDSYNVFYGSLGPPPTGQSAVWAKNMHSLVNRKLSKQRLDKFLQGRSWPASVVTDLQAHEDQLMAEPSMEVLQKKYMVNREEPIVWRNVSTALLAILMGQEQIQSGGGLSSSTGGGLSGSGALDALDAFISSLSVIVGSSGQANGKELQEILQRLRQLSVSEARELVEHLKYDSVVGPKKPLKKIEDASRLLKAGQCINGTCV